MGVTQLASGSPMPIFGNKNRPAIEEIKLKFFLKSWLSDHKQATER